MTKAEEMRMVATEARAKRIEEEKAKALEIYNEIISEMMGVANEGNFKYVVPIKYSGCGYFTHVIEMLEQNGFTVTRQYNFVIMF